MLLPEENTVGELVTELSGLLLANHQMMCAAESCTGGLIAGVCTAVPGASNWFERGFVTYSNAAKHDEIDVPTALIEAHGAVSEEVARAMAAGALANSRAQWSVAVTGIAGPDGGTPEKPVGLVWFGFAHRRALRDTAPSFTVDAECHQFAGHRAAVRSAAVQHALAGLIARVSA